MQTPIDMNDLDYLTKRFTIAYGIDYYSNDAKVILLFELAQQKGYSKEEFKKQVNEFLSTNSYPTWTPADFFKIARPKVYTIEKVKELTNGTLKGFKPCTWKGSTVWVEEHNEILPPFEKIETKAVKIIEMNEIKKYYSTTNTR